MIVDITNEILTKLKGILDLEVTTSYPDLSPTLPLVTLDELNNITDVGTIDSSGHTHSYTSLEINIYTSGSKRVSEAKSIRNKIDGVLADEYRMVRTFSQSVPNFLDTNVYRYKLIYSFRINKNKTIYRG